MKKLLSVMVAVAMCVCLCLPAFAADGDLLGGALDDLDLEGFNLDTIKEDLNGVLGGGDSNPLEGIKSTIDGLLGSNSGSGDVAGNATTDDAAGGLLAGFDPTGALSSFVDSLSLDQLGDLFSGLTDALASVGISLPGSGEGSEGGFDILSILGGNSGSGAGIASIMDIFGGVLETLGFDSSIIESLGQSDIVNFFANLYMGSVPEEPTTEEPTTEEPTTEEPTTEAPTTEAPTTEPYNPPMGVNDGAAVVAACATLSVAAAAIFVCTRKKHA